MRTAIDSNVISAIWSGEPSVPRLLVQLEMARQEGALAISPVVFAELHAYPGAAPAYVTGFAQSTGIAVDYRLDERVWDEAGLRFSRYAERRKRSAGTAPKRLLADFLIGAHALVHADRLLTLDPARYTVDFPEVLLF